MKTGIMALALWWGSSLLAQAQSYTAAQIQADLQQLKAGIIAFQPKVVESAPQFVHLADSLMETLPDSLSIFEAYRYCSQLITFAREGHYELGTRDDAVHQPVYQSEVPILPFTVCLVEGQLYVWRAFSKEGTLPSGAQIEAINGRPTTEILALLRSATPSDGAIQTYRDLRIMDNFPWFYHFYVEQATTFTLTLRPTKDAAPQQITVEGLVAKARIQQALARYKSKKTAPSIDDVYTLKQEGKVAILTLKTFSASQIKRYKLRSKPFYKSIFSTLKTWGVERLVVDLRNNQGGRKAFARDLVPFILQNDHRPPFLTYSLSWKGQRKQVPMPRPHALAFPHPIYVLTNGQTYSAGGVIARHLKEYAGATTIGEETGTRYTQFVAGSKQYVYLEQTGLRIGVPCYWQGYPTATHQTPTDRGLLPDVPLKPSLDDWLNRRDVVLEKALELARE